MKSHKFNVADAEKFGIKKAVILEHLKYHQQANSADDQYIIDGKSYAFLKPDTIEKMFPYFNYKSISRWLRELEEDGIIESIKPKKSQGKHLKFYHVFRDDNKSNSQNEKRGNSQNENSKNAQNENSSNSNLCENIPSVCVAGKTFDESVTIREVMDKIDPSDIEDQITACTLHIWNDLDTAFPNSYTNRKAKFKTWRTPIRRLVEVNERSIKEIWKVWRRAHNDEFWRNNILSTSKLRKKFDQLSAKFNTQKKDDFDGFIDSLYE